MAGLGNDFAADAAAEAAIEGFAAMGVVKGTAAALGTTVAAGVGAAVALAVPVAIAGAIIYCLTHTDSPRSPRIQSAAFCAALAAVMMSFLSCLICFNHPPM